MQILAYSFYSQCIHMSSLKKYPPPPWFYCIPLDPHGIPPLYAHIPMYPHYIDHEEQIPTIFPINLYKSPCWLVKTHKSPYYDRYVYIYIPKIHDIYIPYIPLNPIYIPWYSQKSHCQKMVCGLWSFHDWIDGYPPMTGKSTHVTRRNAHIPK